MSDPSKFHPDREAQLADGMLDREEGEDYNPNPEAQVDAQRTLFDERNEQLLHDRQENAGDMASLQHRLSVEANAANHNPEHQKMVPLQKEHEATDVPETHAGKDVQASVLPMLHDGSMSPPVRQTVDELNDPNGPKVPVQGSSLRKDL